MSCCVSDVVVSAQMARNERDVNTLLEDDKVLLERGKCDRIYNKVLLHKMCLRVLKSSVTCSIY